MGRAMRWCGLALGLACANAPAQPPAVDAAWRQRMIHENLADAFRSHAAVVEPALKELRATAPQPGTLRRRLQLAARYALAQQDKGSAGYCDEVRGWLNEARNAGPDYRAELFDLYAAAKFSKVCTELPAVDIRALAGALGDPARMYFALPAYERRYRALELTLERRFSSVASLGASHVWSQLRGNIEGYVQSTSDGRNIATSVAFDFASLMDGAYGPLPGDRRHVIKACGHYQPTPQWRIGANVLMQSGAPKSCLGFVPRTAPDCAPVDGYGGAASYTSATSFCCLGDDKRTRLTQRGSLGRLPWTYNADLTVSYLPQFAAGRLVLQASVFNVMDARQTTFVDQQRDLSRANTNLQYSSDPNTRAAVRFNPNYDQIAATQAPRTVQLTLRYQL